MSGPGNERVRVLVVDDSAFARKVIREVLARDRQIDVVDFARDGLEALEKIATLKPDVITLDLVMPNLDGIGVLKALPREGAPRVLVVSFSDADTELGAEALSLGAVELVKKPTALATDRMYELSTELLEKIRALKTAHPLPPEAHQPRAVATAPLPPTLMSIVAVGASTGGPQALTRLIASLPKELPVPVVIALHIPAGYTAAIAKRIEDVSQVKVVEIADGTALRGGTVYFAPGGIHLKVRREGEALVGRLDPVPTQAAYTPSVNVLFESCVEAAQSGVLGVVLTGMGDDGYLGASRIRAAGGFVLTESAQSAVIYGMPRVVKEAGLSNDEAPIEELSARVMRWLNGPPR